MESQRETSLRHWACHPLIGCLLGCSTYEPNIVLHFNRGIMKKFLTILFPLSLGALHKRLTEICCIPYYEVQEETWRSSIGQNMEPASFLPPLFWDSVGRREFHSCLVFGAKRKGINEAEENVELPRHWSCKALECPILTKRNQLDS